MYAAPSKTPSSPSPNPDVARCGGRALDEERKATGLEGTTGFADDRDDTETDDDCTTTRLEEDADEGAELSDEVAPSSPTTDAHRRASKPGRADDDAALVTAELCPRAEACELTERTDEANEDAEDRESAAKLVTARGETAEELATATTA